MEFTADSFIKAFTSWKPEEQQKVRDALSALAPKKEKVVKAPAEPVLDPAYVVAEPMTKGPNKGKPRWQNTETENYVFEFPAAAPAGKKSAKAPAAKAAPAAPVADDEARDKRLMGRMTKEEQQALSKEDKKRRNELKKIASEERKASRSPEEQAKIDARVAAMQAGRAKSKAAAGGSPSAEEAEESGSAEE
jgi:hypothetical protein